MKTLLTLLIFLCFCFTTSAQAQNRGDYELKVSSYKFKTVKGHLKMVNAEGIAVEDYKGNYIIFRTADIIKIKIKKRGLGFGNAVTTGTLLGLGIGGSIWSLDETGESTAEMAKLTAALTLTGAVVGTAVGGFSELANKKLSLNVKGNADYFKNNYQRLEKYINYAPETLHVSN